MSDPLRAAVVGCGGAGENHAAGYERTDRAELVAVCDLDAELSRALATEHGVPAYDSLDDLLDEERPDVVSVATGEYAHEKPTVAALRDGCDVLCEKIMAHSLDAGERMVEAAAESGRTLGVDYNYRHMPLFARLRAAVAEGELGDVRLLTAEAHAYGWHHVLDLLVYLLGEPRRVSATLRDDPAATPYDWNEQAELLYVPSHVAAATVEFASGAVATVAATKHTDLEEHLIDLSIYGDGGSARVDAITPTDTSGAVRPGPIADDLRAQPSITLGEAFERSVDAFAGAVARGERPPTTGADGLAIMRVENAVVRAADRDEPVDLSFEAGRDFGFARGGQNAKAGGDETEGGGES
jgi:predicted dehydrogenase